MDGKGLEAMNRMARNMPVKKLKTIRTNTRLGEIYIAYGRGKDEKDNDVWHGMWIIDQVDGFDEVANAGIELYGCLSEKQAKQAFFDLAWQGAEVFRG